MLEAAWRQSEEDMREKFPEYYGDEERLFVLYTKT